MLPSCGLQRVRIHKTRANQSRPTHKHRFLFFFLLFTQLWINAVLTMPICPRALCGAVNMKHTNHVHLNQQKLQQATQRKEQIQYYFHCFPSLSFSRAAFLFVFPVTRFPVHRSGCYLMFHVRTCFSLHCPWTPLWCAACELFPATLTAFVINNCPLYPVRFLSIWNTCDLTVDLISSLTVFNCTHN